MQMHKALTYINLPPDNRKAPGDEISPQEWEACDPPQTEENIQELIDSGAISEDMDAEILPAHRPVNPNDPTQARMIEEAKFLVERGETSPGIVALAETELVSNGDDAAGGDKSA